MEPCFFSFGFRSLYDAINQQKACISEKQYAYGTKSNFQKFEKFVTFVKNISFCRTFAFAQTVVLSIPSIVMRADVIYVL